MLSMMVTTTAAVTTATVLSQNDGSDGGDRAGNGTQHSQPV
jgi:hypothetical protein